MSQPRRASVSTRLKMAQNFSKFCLHALLGVYPGAQYTYYLGENLLEYITSEKDLGVDINSKLNFNDQCYRLINKANQQFGLTRRMCYFVLDR